MLVLEAACLLLAAKVDHVVEQQASKPAKVGSRGACHSKGRSVSLSTVCKTTVKEAVWFVRRSSGAVNKDTSRPAVERSNAKRKRDDKQDVKKMYTWLPSGSEAGG